MHSFTAGIRAVVPLLAGLVTPASASPQPRSDSAWLPSERAALHAALPGCYVLTTGPWPRVADSLYAAPPRVVELQRGLTDPRRVPSGRVRTIRGAAPTYQDGAMWWTDSVRAAAVVVFRVGFGAVELRLEPRGATSTDSLVGSLTDHRDYAGPRPAVQVTAVRVPCVVDRGGAGRRGGVP